MGFGGFEDPKERKAAQDAVAAMEAQRALADAQTQVLADAIREGFGMLASAVLTAAGHYATTEPTDPCPDGGPVADKCASCGVNGLRNGSLAWIDKDWRCRGGCEDVADLLQNDDQPDN